MTSLYSRDIILALFNWIIKLDYKNKYLVTGDWSQSIHNIWAATSGNEPSDISVFSAKIHIRNLHGAHVSLWICAVWSESSLGAFWMTNLSRYFENRIPLWKHAYSNIMKILPPKNENFKIKNSDIFLISAQNIDCVYSLEPSRRGGSNEYQQSMFWAEIRKIMYTPVNPSFTI